MRLFSLLAGCSMANHTQTENGMGLKNKDGELIDWGDPFEIVHCNNPSTDYPEMKARVIHKYNFWIFKTKQSPKNRSRPKIGKSLSRTLSIEFSWHKADPTKIKIGKRYFERNLSGKFHELLFHYRDEFYEAIVPNDLVDLTFDDNDSKFISLYNQTELNFYPPKCKIL